MKQIALKYFTDLDLSLVALCLFFGSFLILSFVVFCIEPKKKYDQLSQIPLEVEEGENV